MTPLDEVRRELATNKRQWEAFNRSGDTLVVAPPGSGKTKLLTAKLAQDFLTELPSPHGAACITYSNAAADELRFRLAALHAERRANLFVGTVHAFALQAIVVPYGRLTGHAALLDARVSTEAEQDRFISQAIAEIYQGEPPWGVENEMRVLRRRCLPAEEPDPEQSRIAAVARRYAEQLAENGLIDFEDMIRAAVEMVEGNAWLRRVLAARFSKLYIDEYQDLGPGLHRLARALCFDQTADATLFAVADPDQCIYTFAGADPALLDDLKATPSVATIRLVRNYRCGAVITHAARTALDHDLETESDHEGGRVEIHQVEGWVEGQARDAAERALVAHEEHHVPYEEMAVLVAKNSECLEAAAVFKARGLPTFVRRADQYPRTPGTSLVEALAAWATSAVGESGFTLAELLRRWRTLRREMRGAPPTDLVELLLDFRGRGDDPASDFVVAILDLGLVERLLERQETQEDANALDRMRNDFESGDFSHLTVEDLGERALARNRVHVLTMHGSKGLEFDYVFMLGLDKGRFPGFWAKERDIVQNRRQFYVSVTRARDEVHLYYTGWNQNQYGRIFREGPSPFIVDLQAAMHIG